MGCGPILGPSVKLTSSLVVAFSCAMALAAAEEEEEEEDERRRGARVQRQRAAKAAVAATELPANSGPKTRVWLGGGGETAEFSWRLKRARGRGRALGGARRIVPARAPALSPHARVACSSCMLQVRSCN